MPEETTPGQIAYEAYTRLSTPDRPWARLHPNQRDAWEAAALAVLEDALRQILAVQAETARYVHAVVSHWHEFGPEYGFAETIVALERWFEAQAGPARREEEETS